MLVSSGIRAYNGVWVLPNPLCSPHHAIGISAFGFVSLALSSFSFPVILLFFYLLSRNLLSFTFFIRTNTFFPFPLDPT